MKKGIFSKMVITFVITANAMFTSAVLYVFLRTGAEPVVLIGSWFTFTTTELMALAQIKKKKEANKIEN